MSSDFFDTEKFIEEIKHRPALWKTFSPDYGDRTIKKRCWEELVDIFIDNDESDNEWKRKDIENMLQRRWKNIRGCYTRELLRRKPSSNRVASLRKKEYVYFKQLQFLNNYIHIKQFDDNSRNEQLEPPIIKTEIIYEPDYDDRTDINEIRNNSSQVTSEDSLDQDEDKLFLLSLLSTLKKVPDRKKIATKIQIMSILQNATSQDP